MPDTINPATKLPHTARHLKGQPEAVAAALRECKRLAPTRKRSVKALMAAKGYAPDATGGWVVA